MEQSRYETSLFKLVHDKFWQAFEKEREPIISFLEGICQVFNLGLAFHVKREGERLIILNVYPEDAEDERFKKVPLMIDENLKAIMDEKGGYACNTTQEDSVLKSLKIDSFLLVPLEPLLEEYLILCNRKESVQFNEFYTSYDLFLTKTLARCINIFPKEDILNPKNFSFRDHIIENLYEQVSEEHRLIKQRDKLEVCMKLLCKLSPSGNLLEILDKGLNFILEFLHSTTGYICLLDEITQKLRVITAIEEKKKIGVIETPFDQTGIECQVIKEKTPTYLNDIDINSPFNSNIATALGLKVRSILASPISIRIKTEEREVIGVIVLLNKPSFFSEGDKEVLRGLSEAISISIQNWLFIEERVKAQMMGKLGPYLPHLDLLTRDSTQVKREEVSILFADMSGFVRMVEQLGREEELPVTLSEYFSRMSDIVFERGGVVDKFIGDAIMAIFMKPENALFAAFDIKNEFGELKERWKDKWKHHISAVIDVNIKCGIATGYVFIGDLGSDIRKEYTAIGGPVNLASRLVTEVDEVDVEKVWIDAPTFKKTKDIITQSSSPLTKSFRGFAAEQWVYEIISIKEERPEEVYSKVEKYIEEGRIRNALLNLDRIIRIGGKELKVKALLRKAKLLKDIVNYKEAYECYEKVLKEQPDCLEALEGKTEYLKSLKRIGE